jgi:hypothetical protein
MGLAFQVQKLINFCCTAICSHLLQLNFSVVTQLPVHGEECFAKLMVAQLVVECLLSLEPADHCDVHKSPSLVPVFSQSNPVTEFLLDAF